MKIYAFLLILCLTILGCGRDFTEYELDEGSFKADTMAQIKKETGIDIPDRAKGLKFHYIPPIDPIVFAKIEIPSESKKLMETQIAAFTDISDFPKDFANDRCQWWLSGIENMILSKKTTSNGYYLEIYLVQEKEQLILFLKYFTI